MTISNEDRAVLRPLAERYAELAHLPVQQERLERYRKTNDLEDVRPVVLIDEVPWGEIRDDALVCRCTDAVLRGFESQIRKALYQWDHFQADFVIPPVFLVGKRTHSTGIGLEVRETAIQGETGTRISAHEYVDQLKTEDDLEKLTLPTLTYLKEETEQAVALAGELFEGLMPVEAVGSSFYFNAWDQIARYRGVDSLLMDLAMRPELMHKTIQKFMDIGAAELRQRAELGLFDNARPLVHCTPARTRELPSDVSAGSGGPADTWGRCAAQIFGSVSPAMHDEFDLAYNEKLFGDFGLVYYGCCEPMDTKVDILRKRFKNLRKISITPWANHERVAETIGRDYVLAAKPNPAFVASPAFNPDPVEAEITQTVEACKRHNTVCEFVIKDISTIANRPENLTQWAATVNAVLDRHYG